MDMISKEIPCLTFHITSVHGGASCLVMSSPQGDPLGNTSFLKITANRFTGFGVAQVLVPLRCTEGLGVRR